MNSSVSFVSGLTSTV